MAPRSRGRRGPSIPQRKRIYIGCEGRAEVEYARWLQDLVNESHKQFHLSTKDLHGGGNPIHMLEIALKDRARQQALSRFHASALLLDADTCSGASEIVADANRRAKKHGFIIVWQCPCGEGFLLRHVRGLRAAAEQSAREARDDFRRTFNREPPLELHEIRGHFGRVGNDMLLEVAGSTEGFQELLHQLRLP